MAVAKITTENVIGTLQDITDTISNISPTDTPFQKMCKKGKASSSQVEWQIEALAAAVTTNALVEGADAPAASQELTTMQYNRTQIFGKTASVTSTANITKKSGRGKELVHQLMNKNLEIKRDIEASLTQNGPAVAGDIGTVTARKLKGLEGWIGDNLALPADGSPVAANPEANGGLGSAMTAGTAEAFTQDRLNVVLDSCYSSGGKPDTIMAGPGNRRVFSGFAGVSSAQNLDVEGGRIVNSMKIYESDWGDLKVVPNLFQSNASVFVLDSSDFEILTLNPLESIELPVTGLSKSVFLTTELTLKVGNWHKHGKVQACT